MKRKTILIGLSVLAVGYGIFQWQTHKQGVTSGGDAKPNNALVSVKLPEQFSDSAVTGMRLFEAKCASCHGRNAAGQESVAPPLIHKIYEPSHHGDESFQRAAALGVRAHHWRFGDMPPVEGLTRADISDIIVYVRELQRANGIN